MDEFMKSVCVKHGLTTISFMFMSKAKFDPFLVYVHWMDGVCASGGGKTIEEALHRALAAMHQKKAVAALESRQKETA